MIFLIRRGLWPLVIIVLLVAGLACGDGGDDGEATISASPTADGPTPIPTPPLSGTPLTGIPEGFPVYVNAELVESENFESRLVARFETGDPRSQVADFYSGALDKDPWAVLTMTELADQDASLIVFTSLDDPNLSGTIVIRRLTSDGEKTDIVVEFVLPGGAPLTPIPIE